MSTRSARDRILDAAAAAGAVSTQRPSIAELARLAGVSRPTVYRNFTDAEDVFRALWEREIQKMVAGHELPSSTLAELASRIVEVADQISHNRALARSIETDSSLFARYILERFGRSQRLLFDLIRDSMKTLQNKGEVRAGNLDEMTAMVMLIVQSAVQSRAMIREFLPDPAWSHELEHAIRGYLS